LYAYTETNERGEKVMAQTSLPLRQVPISFTTEGRFNDNRNLFNELYQGKDFFIVEKMDVNSNIDLLLSQVDLWHGDIQLSKYQFVPGKDFIPEQAYLAIKKGST
jgi:hypothetical protein